MVKKCFFLWTLSVLHVVGFKDSPTQPSSPPFMGVIVGCSSIQLLVHLWVLNYLCVTTHLVVVILHEEIGPTHVWKGNKFDIYAPVFIDGLVQEKHNSNTLAMELRLSCTNPDGLVQERCNSSAVAMELCLSCTNPLLWYIFGSKIFYTCAVLYNDLLPCAYKKVQEQKSISPSKLQMMNDNENIIRITKWEFKLVLI